MWNLVVLVLGAIVLVLALGLVSLALQYRAQRLWEPASHPVSRDEVPAPMQSLLDYAAPFLKTEGFDFAGMLCGRQVTAASAAADEYFAVYHHPALDVHAVVMAATRPTRRWPFSVCLWSFFDDGQSLLTVNGRQHEMLPYPAQVGIVDAYAPNFAEQLAAHLQAERGYAGGKMAPAEAREAGLPFPRDLLARLEGAGLLHRCGDIAGEPTYRMTLGTALRYAWRAARGNALRARMEAMPKGPDRRMPEAPSEVDGAAQERLLARTGALGPGRQRQLRLKVAAFAACIALAAGLLLVLRSEQAAGELPERRPEPTIASLETLVRAAQESENWEEMLSAARQFHAAAARSEPGGYAQARAAVLVARAAGVTGERAPEFRASLDEAEAILRARLNHRHDERDAVLLADALVMKYWPGKGDGGLPAITEAVQLYEANAEKDDYRLQAARLTLAEALDQLGDAAGAEIALKKNLDGGRGNPYPDMLHHLDYAWFLASHRRSGDAGRLLDALQKRMDVDAIYALSSQFRLAQAALARQRGDFAAVARQLRPVHAIPCPAGTCTADARAVLDAPASLLLVEAYRKLGQHADADALARDLRRQSGCTRQFDATRWRAPLKALLDELKARELQCR